MPSYRNYNVLGLNKSEMDLKIFFLFSTATSYMYEQKYILVIKKGN